MSRSRRAVPRPAGPERCMLPGFLPPLVAPGRRSSRPRARPEAVEPRIPRPRGGVPCSRERLSAGCSRGELGRWVGYGKLTTSLGVVLVGVVAPVVLMTLVIEPLLFRETVSRSCHFTPAVAGASYARAETTAGLTLKKQ